MNVVSASDMRVPHHNLTPNTRYFAYCDRASIKPLKRQSDMDCICCLEMGRLGVSESFLKFSPNLQNSEPSSSESKGGAHKCRFQPRRDSKRTTARWRMAVTSAYVMRLTA